MQSPDPTGRRQNQPKTGCPNLPAPGAIFQGFRPPTGHPGQIFIEIWGLQCYGLNKDLRFTLLAVAWETVGKGSLRGASACDFVAVPWTRWMESLELRSINAVKARMARLEEMGLVDVLRGECGPRGATAPRFRLRWAHVDGAAFEAFVPVPQDQKRTPGPLDLVETDAHQSDTRQTDTHQFDTHKTDTHQTDAPSSKQNKYINSINSNQSINPSVLEVNELIEKMTIELNSFNSNQNQSIQTQRFEATAGTDGVRKPGFDVSSWLREGSREPWPEPLLQGLGGILDPHRIPGLDTRSPWTGEGAWAILQAIRARGRNLGNQGGTLWNALLQPGKGAIWLTLAGPILRQAGWQMEPEDGTPMAARSRAEGSRRLAQMGFSRLPLHGAALERQQRLRDEVVGRERAMDLDFGDDLDDDYAQSPSVEAPMIQPQEEPMIRPEDFNSDVKAELKTSIETFRDASRAALRSPAANRPGGFDDFSQCWRHIVEVLEPMLPLRVNLPDEYRPVAIRQRSQIKMNVVEAVYRAVS